MTNLHIACRSVERAIEDTDELDQAIAGQHSIIEITRLLAELQSHLHTAWLNLLQPEFHQDEIIEIREEVLA